MSADEYYSVFRKLGYRATGEGTLLTEEWINDFGETIMVTRASELSPEDRREAAEYIQRTLGIDFPVHARVH